MVAQADALDQYFIKNPEEFFGRPMETAVVDPDNPFVVKAHLPCAAQELPLKVTGKTYFDLKAYRAGDRGAGPGAPPARFRSGRSPGSPAPGSPKGSEHPGYRRELCHLPDRQEAPLGLD